MAFLYDWKWFANRAAAGLAAVERMIFGRLLMLKRVINASVARELRCSQN
jgi:hypothetical protein